MGILMEKLTLLVDMQSKMSSVETKSISPTAPLVTIKTEHNPKTVPGKNKENIEQKEQNKETKKQSFLSMKPATFDGTTSWIDYKSHFEMCAELNNWGYDKKGLYLAVCLRGLAQGVLGNLPSEDQKDFKK